MAPIVLLGLAVAGGLAFLKRSSGSSAAPVDAALIDPSEKAHPNAALAQQAIAVAMTRNSASLYEMTAIAIETRLGMPKTAANVRTWAKMAAQGGQQVAGEEDVGGSYTYGELDEVGAARRAVRAVYAKHKAAKKKPAPKRAPARRAARAVPALSSSSSSSADTSAPPLEPVDTWPAAPAPAGYPGASASASAPLVPWSSDYAEPIADGDDDDDDDRGEVGATSRRSKKLPDWLRFSATQSKLTGDPALIRATAQVMRRMGYAEHADIHLKSIR